MSSNTHVKPKPFAFNSNNTVTIGGDGSSYASAVASTTLVADKIILRGIEINADYRPPRPRMSYPCANTTPGYNFTTVTPVT